MSGAAQPGPGGRLPELAWMAVGDLWVDPAYQRSIESHASRKVIERIVAGFDWSLFGVVTVARYDGRDRILDGQHRVEAARRLGIEQVPCLFVGELPAQRAAALFVDANRIRVSMDPLSLHRARVAAGDPEAVAVASAAEAAGVTVAAYRRPACDLPAGHTVAVAAIAKAIKKYGQDAATEGLRQTARLWRLPVGQILAHRIVGIAAASAELGPDRTAAACADADGARGVLERFERRAQSTLWEAIHAGIRSLARGMAGPAAAAAPAETLAGAETLRAATLTNPVLRRCSECQAPFRTRLAVRSHCDRHTRPSVLEAEPA